MLRSLLVSVCLFLVRPTAVEMPTSWVSALDSLPVELREAVVSDGYPSAVIFAQCFRTEEILDKYASGLLLIRKVIHIPDLTADTIAFSPTVGLLRGLRAAAVAEVAATEKLERQRQEAEDRVARNKEELLEAEALAMAKVSAKDAAKEQA